MKIFFLFSINLLILQLKYPYLLKIQVTVQTEWCLLDFLLNTVVNITLLCVKRETPIGVANPGQ